MPCHALEELADPLHWLFQHLRAYACIDAAFAISALAGGQMPARSSRQHNTMDVKAIE